MKKCNVFMILLAVCTTGSIVVSCNKSNQSVSSNSLPVISSSIGNGKIVYVDIDTVFKYYDMFKEKSDSLKNREKQLSADLDNKKRIFQSNVVDFNNKVNKGLVTNQSAQEMQQQLKNQQQELYSDQEKYASELQEIGGVNQRIVYQSIMDYLKEFNKDRKYAYILANTFPSTLLYADLSMNITKIVLAGINEKFRANKSKKKK